MSGIGDVSLPCLNRSVCHPPVLRGARYSIRPIAAREALSKKAAAVGATAWFLWEKRTEGRRSESLFLDDLLHACPGSADQPNQPDFPRRGIVKSATYQIPVKADFAARPASQEKPPTTAKNTAAIQASESKSLCVMIAVKIVRAAISHREAITRPNQ
jgi:hypothetical protein